MLHIVNHTEPGAKIVSGLIDIDVQRHNQERYERICQLVEEIIIYNPECMISHRDDLIELIGEDQIKWRMEVLLQIPEEHLLTLKMFVKKRHDFLEQFRDKAHFEED